jgi:large subunit ribosomal protein L9
MEIILNKNLPGLGKTGDRVKVKDGYARNYLIPRKIAIPVTPGALRDLELRRKALDLRSAREKERAESLRAFLEHVVITLQRQSGDEERIYGSVTSQDILSALYQRPDVVKVLEDHKFSLDKKQILLDEPIKVLGSRNIEIRLYPEVIAKIVLRVEQEN